MLSSQEFQKQDSTLKLFYGTPLSNEGTHLSQLKEQLFDVLIYSSKEEHHQNIEYTHIQRQNAAL